MLLVIYLFFKKNKEFSLPTLCIVLVSPTHPHGAEHKKAQVRIYAYWGHQSRFSGTGIDQWSWSFRGTCRDSPTPHTCGSGAQAHAAQGAPLPAEWDKSLPRSAATMSTHTQLADNKCILASRSGRMSAQLVRGAFLSRLVNLMWC